MIKYFSMFSGIGGFDLALNRHGHECVGHSEIDKWAIQTYEKNFGKDVKNYGDATQINTRELPDFDMLCGGFPCQAFSIAGKRRGFKDTRGTLFFEIARVIEAKKPSYLLLENVKGLLNHNKGTTFKVIIQTLDELGYNTQWMVLNSKFFGVPQNRERVFIIGNLRDKPRPEILPFRFNAREVQEIYGTTYKSHRANEIREHKGSPTLTSNMGTGGNNIPMVVARCLDANMHKGVDTKWFFEKGRRNIITHSLYPRSSKTGKGGTGHLTKNDNTAYCLDSGNNQAIETNKLRRLTPLECERLQGFPDNWTKYGSHFKQVQVLGNIWKNVKLKDAIEKSLTDNQSCVLSITKDGKNGETQKLSIQSNEKIKENAKLKLVIEVLTAENYVCDTTNLGKDMVMLYNPKETSKVETLTNKNHILEKMEEKSTCPLLKISSNATSKKERLFIISILKKGIIDLKIFLCAKTEKPITNAIILWKKLPQSSLKEDLFVLGMENTTLMSDTQRYKQLGNAVTVKVIEAIIKEIKKEQKENNKS